jgi:photosystem II stability/assembly factor-like uncharacterized protein
MKKYVVPALFVLLASISVICISYRSNDPLTRPHLSPGEYMAHQRMYPHNAIHHQNYLDAMKQTQAFKNSEKLWDYNWEFVGPTNIGGRITDIEVHPQTPTTIYLGAATGGVWKSEDEGDSWDYMFEGMDLISIGDIAIDPNDDEVVYAGTGEANSSSFSFIGNGIFKSTDGGESWNFSGLEMSAYIGRIIVDYDNSERVFAAACGNLFTPSNERGIYRSTDGGLTWEQKLFVNDTVAAIDLVQHPTNPDILYAGMWERTRGLEYRHSFGEGTGIWKTTDGGDTWEELTNGLPSGDAGRPGIAIAKSNPDVLYVYFDMPDSEVEVYRTENGGDSWTEMNSNQLNGMNSNFGWYFGQVRVHPEDENMVWVMGVEMYRSSNGGSSWQDGTGSSWVHVDHHAMCFDEANDRIWLGNDGGLYLSQNNGNSWNKINNLPFTQFYAIDVDYQNPQRLIGGTQDNNTVMTNTGSTDDWQAILGGDGMYCLIDYSNPDILYAEYQWGNLFKSTNGGGNMDYIGWMWSNDRINWSAPIAMDPVNSNVLYFGSYRVWKSVNNGNSWEDVSGDITKGIDQYFHTVSTIAVSPVDNMIVIAGTGDGLVHISVDAGFTWNNITNGLPDRWVTRVAGDPFDANTIYATVSGFRWDEQTPHVYKSTDLGQTWESISGNLPDLPVNDIVLDPENQGYIYIGTDAGVFFTNNGGESWTMLSDGLPNVAVCAMKIHNPTRTLVVGTYGVSMWKLDMDDLVGEKEISYEQDKLFTVYPNPIGNSINLTGPMDQVDSFKLLDLSGREIMSAGANQLSDVGSLPKGSYVLNLIDKTGKTIATKKIVKQ